MPKLPKGMFQRGTRYYTRLRARGRDVWRSLGPNYREACRLLREVRGERRVTVDRTTVSQAAQSWLDVYVKAKRNAKGVELAAYRVGAYLSEFMGPKLVAAVTANDLLAYGVWLKGKRLTTQTVAHILSDARCLLGWCDRSGLVAKSPVPRKLLPRVQERPPDRLTNEQAAALRAMPEPYGWIARLGLGTGLRWGELTRAQSTDVQGGWLIVHQTKSGKVRRVPLWAELRAELRGRVGKLVPYGELSSGAFATAVRRLTGMRFHAHQMRHTFACVWLERGGSLAALQAVLGHSTIVTTQRYARLSDEHVWAEAERIGGRLVADAVATGFASDSQECRKIAEAR